MTKVDLDSKVGTSELVVEKPLPAGDSEVKITDGVTRGLAGVGWHCKVCDCFLKDSMAYLDHINGKKHQRTLGFTMRVEQSSVETVKARLEAHKRKLADGADQGGGKTSHPRGGEGGGQSAEKEPSAAQKLAAMDDEEEKARRLRKESRKLKREEKKVKKLEEDEEEEGEDQEEEAEMDPEMAAMMGFGNFAPKKK